MLKWLIVVIMAIALLFSTIGLLVNEKFVLLFIVDIGILIVGSSILNIMSNAAVKKKARVEGALDAFICQHVEGLGIGANISCELRSFADRVEIIEKQTTRIFAIPYERLRALEFKSEQEFKELDRSVVGRAVIGGLLVPGIGAIVGGMSGLKSRKKGKMKYFIIINYLDKDGELKGITFENGLNIIRMNNFKSGVNKAVVILQGSRPVEL